MRKLVVPILLASVLIYTGCENSDDNNSVFSGTEISTQDLNTDPQFFNFENVEFVETYDIKFYQPGMSYMVGLNASAGVLFAQSIDTDFVTAEMPIDSYTGEEIGESWMDISTYNPSDHSIQGNGSIYFVRSASAEWVKLEVIQASPTFFEIKFAVQNLDGTYQPTEILSVSYSSSEPVYFDFSTSSAIVPGNWDVAFTVVPEYAPGMGFMYLPSIILNLENDTQVSISNDQFDEISSVPNDATWLNDTLDNRILGYNGDNAILVYHPEPPYNHKVIIENPELAYFINCISGSYKLDFEEYSSGILIFVFDELLD